MSLTLDPQTEQRISATRPRTRHRRHQVIHRALDLLDAQEDWLLRNREATDELLDESTAQVERGETYTPEQARSTLAERRRNRTA